MYCLFRAVNWQSPVVICCGCHVSSCCERLLQLKLTIVFTLTSLEQPVWSCPTLILIAVTCVLTRVFSARQHICLARYMLSPVRPSVHQTGVSQKNVWSLVLWNFHHGSPSLWFLQHKFHPEILRGSHRAGASNKGLVGKISSFLSLSVNISKTVADTAKVTLMTNRKSYMGFPLTPRSTNFEVFIHTHGCLSCAYLALARLFCIR